MFHTDSDIAVGVAVNMHATVPAAYSMSVSYEYCQCWQYVLE